KMALVTSVSDEDLRRVKEKLLTMFCDHDRLDALAFLFAHILKPLEHNIDPDTLDSDELRKLRIEAQRDSLDNYRLNPQVALALEKAQQLAAAAGTVGEVLLDQDSVGPHLQAVLKDAGLADLARVAKGYCARMQALEKGSEAEQRTNG